MDLNLRPDQETPDINFSEDLMETETPDIDFAEHEENETPELNLDDTEAVENDEKPVETEGSDIDDLDEGDNDVLANENCTTTNQSKSKEKSNETRSSIRLLSLPSARVKQIMKTDQEVMLITGECTFLVAKATELFIESLAREAFLHTAQSKKKTVQKRDVDAAIENVDALMFLEGMMNG